MERIKIWFKKPWVGYACAGCIVVLLYEALDAVCGGNGPPVAVDEEICGDSGIHRTVHEDRGYDHRLCVLHGLGACFGEHVYGYGIIR